MDERSPGTLNPEHPSDQSLPHVCLMVYPTPLHFALMYRLHPRICHISISCPIMMTPHFHFPHLLYYMLLIYNLLIFRSFSGDHLRFLFCL